MHRINASALGAFLLMFFGISLTGCSIGGNKSVDMSTSQVSANTNSVQPNGTNGIPSTTSNVAKGSTNSANSTIAGNNQSSQSNSSAGSGSVSVDQPLPSQTTQSTSPFPRIVSMAMSNFSKNIFSYALAPTIFPASNSGSNVLYYDTSQLTAPLPRELPGFISTYHVQFNATNGLIANFSGSRYDLMENASAALQSSVSGFQSGSGEGVRSSLQLSNKITGSLVVDANGNGSSASINWNEGRWLIRVTNLQSTTPPTDLAKEVVSYLDKNLMPVPNDRAVIMVSTQGTNVNVMVIWQEGNEIYQVNSYTPCNNPVETSLAMAISMKPYF